MSHGCRAVQMATNKQWRETTGVIHEDGKKKTQTNKNMLPNGASPWQKGNHH